MGVGDILFNIGKYLFYYPFLYFFVYPLRYFFTEPIIGAAYWNDPTNSRTKNALGTLYKIFVLSPFGIFNVCCFVITFSLCMIPMFGSFFMIITVFYAYWRLFKKIKKYNKGLPEK
jgi:hypothetical protein